MNSALPHIGIFGRCNSGKSTLFNALLGQPASIVSPLSGTTTDVVRRNMEWPGLGAVVLIDTAGLDDGSELGAARIAATLKVASEVDLGLVLLTGADDALEKDFAKRLKRVIFLKDNDLAAGTASFGATEIDTASFDTARVFSVVADALKGFDAPVDMTAGLLRAGQHALLVMPQDAGAPQGRLISAQTQMIRHLLDKHCVVACCQLEEYPAALAGGTDLVITDSQVLAAVARQTPDNVPLTTFSILMASAKGDLNEFVRGAAALNCLSEHSRVLIAESCTHVPAAEDIGTVKIPRLLRRRFGEGLVIDNVRGGDFPDDLSPYDLVIHCGGCMQTRQFMLSRQAAASQQNVPMTNYGVAIACLACDISRLAFPED